VLVGGHSSDTANFGNADRSVVVNLKAGTARGDGHDSLRGIDNVDASRFDDRVIGNDGPNAFYSRAGADVFVGNGGRDFAVSAGRGARFDLGDGGDFVVAREPRRIDAGAGRDLISLWSASHVDGGPDNDIFDIARGDSDFEGGDGMDFAAFGLGFGGRRPITADLGAGTTTNGRASATFASIEGFASGEGPDVLVGSDGADVILAAGGDDSISGLDGDDRLLGESGDDAVDGGGGTDRCRAESTVNCELPAPSPPNHTFGAQRLRHSLALLARVNLKMSRVLA
jgi:Ca2+-binding RTX toxin-like protein